MEKTGNSEFQPQEQKVKVKLPLRIIFLPESFLLLNILFQE